ncbi:glycosyltransferase family 2 protein [Lyngbya sp. PCC 8106]|uniref:glycosyltransferase family 2 protein n=1 Tax=Lyngbya sp. (strain PCC 8106) TaxID=313612 RepID=UPI0000EAB25C|nr:glycosyltransferase family 2 protein [Lyngbya sp. PCC 8106]EAW35723.1 glycosyl transferase [Lyngbya sp. PCC 8106]
MNKDFDVSVIIPTYNRLTMLKEALTSILSQDYQEKVEVIVVDDNSGDGTSEFIAREYPDIHLITLNENVGCPAARNLGINQAKGRYIAFLDSDDIWKANYLSSQILALEGRERSFCVSTVLLWDTVQEEKIVKLQKYDLDRFISPIHQLLVTSSFIISPSCVVLQSEMFEEVGLFNESFRVGADREFYARCFIHNYQPVFTEQPLVVIRKHNQGQMTDFNASKIEERKQSRIVYLEQLYPLMKKEQQELLPLNRLYAEIYSTAAREFFREKHYIHWITAWIDVAKYTSLGYALFNMMRDLLRFTKGYLPTSALTTIRKFFLSDTLST